MILDKENDIKLSIQQLDRCYNILIPKPEDVFNDFNDEPTESSVNNKDDDSETDDEFETVKIPGLEDNNDELRYLGFLNGRDSEYSRNFQLDINLKFGQNEDNKILIDIIKDLYKELKYSHLVSLNSWIKVYFCLIFSSFLFNRNYYLGFFCG
jgi:hypothetical protein